MWANINAIVARRVFISYIIYAFASFVKLRLRRYIFMYNSVSWHYVIQYKIRYFSWIKNKRDKLSFQNIFTQNLHNTFVFVQQFYIYLNQSINPPAKPELWFPSLLSYLLLARIKKPYKYMKYSFPWEIMKLYTDESKSWMPKCERDWFSISSIRILCLSFSRIFTQKQK